MAQSATSTAIGSGLLNISNILGPLFIPLVLSSFLTRFFVSIIPLPDLEDENQIRAAGYLFPREGDVLSEILKTLNRKIRPADITPPPANPRSSRLETIISLLITLPLREMLIFSGGHRNEDSFKGVKITGYNIDWAERYFLGKFEITGHYNRTNGMGRMISAFIPTLWALLIFSIALCWYDSRIKATCTSTNCLGILPLGDQAFVAVLLTLAGVYGATAYRERSSIHSKWQYLAGIFNEAAKETNPAAKRHLEACIAHDSLSLEMWSHKTFAPTFKEILIESLRRQPRWQHLSEHEIERTVESGIDHDEALNALSLFTSHTSSKLQASGRPSPVIIRGRVRIR